MRDAPFVIVGNLTDRPRLKRSQPVAFDDFHCVNVSTLSCGWRHLWLMEAQSQYAALFHRDAQRANVLVQTVRLLPPFQPAASICASSISEPRLPHRPKDTAFNYKTFSCISLKGHWDHRRSAFMVGILLDDTAACM
jgi:hypothetical protein